MSIMTRTIQMNNKSGSFSARADYDEIGNGMVSVNDWTFDALGILPNGNVVRHMPLAQAQQEYKERLANGWSF